MQVMQALVLIAAVLVAHVIVASRALAAYVQFLSARGVRVAVEAWMLLTLVFAPRAFALCALALALVAGRAHARTARRVFHRAQLMRAKGKRCPTLRALKMEIGITDQQRHRVRWDRMMEARHITPPPRFIRYAKTPTGYEYVARLNAAGFTADKFAKEYAGGIRTYIGPGCLRVHVSGDPRNGALVYVRVVTKDATDTPLSNWPLADAPHGHASVVDGLLIGRDENGEDVRLDIVNDAAFVAGQRGTGKSSFLQQIVAGAALCHDTQLWLADMKEGAEFCAWRPKVHRFSDSLADARKMIADLLVERERRSRSLVSQKLRKWQPGCGFPFILVVIDEAAELDMGGETSAQSMLTKLTRLGRAQGIGVVCATQRPSADWIDTSLRAQCNVAISFRVRDVTESNVALGPGAVRDGYAPHQLPKHRYFLLDSAAVRPLRCRGWFLSDGDVERIAARVPAPAIEGSNEGPIEGSNWTPEGLVLESETEPLDPESNGPAPAPPPEPPEIATSPKRAALWRALVEHPEWMPPASLQKVSGVGRATVFAALAEWLEAGYVEAAGGRYRRRGPRDWRSDLAS